MITVIEWYVPGRCTVLNWLSGGARRAGGISRHWVPRSSIAYPLYIAQESSGLSCECMDVSCGPETSRNEPSITSNRPLHLKLWLLRGLLGGCLSFSFRHQVESRTSWGGRHWALELWRSWSMRCSIEWYAPGQCTVLHWLSGYDCRAGGI